MNGATARIANNPQKYRPLMTNHFNVTIHDLDGMINQADPEKGLIEDSMLSLQVANKTFQGPTLSQQVVHIKRGNMSIPFPGSIDSFQTTATFEVMVNNSAWDILYSWKLAAGNQETEEVGDPEDYWKKVEIDVTTGKGKLIGTWILENAWISSLQEITFDNGANEVKSCTITLQFYKPIWRNASSK